MNHIDELAPHFRGASERWPDAPTLVSHYEAVIEGFNGNAHGVIATVKSFVECVCLTVLGEFGQPPGGSAISTTDLLGDALRCLGLQNDQGGSRVSKLLSAHNKLADALSDIRNNEDPVAHGKDGFLDVLSANEKRAYVLTADSIVALLLAAHDGTDPDLQYTRYSYDRFAHFHDRVDQAVGVDVTVTDEDERQMIVVSVRTASLPEGVQLRIEPSRLLYALDRSAYVEILGSAPVSLDASEGDIESEVVDDVSGESIAAKTVPLVPVVVTAYDGRLQGLRDRLSAYLDSLGFAPSESDLPTLLDSLLATADEHLGLDWASREPLVAAMRVALRRVLLRFAIERDRADQVAQELVSWLQAQQEEAEGF